MANESAITTEVRERVRHNDSDSEIKRNRLARWTVLIFTVMTLSTVPGLLLNYFFLFLMNFKGVSWLAWILGLGFGGIIFSKLYPRKYLITVGQIRAFVTLNPLLSFFNIKGSPNIIYGPGDNISFPWERREEKGNVPLDVITMNFDEKLPGKGSELHVKGSYQYKPDITKADVFIGIDDSTIKGGAIDLIKSRISSKMAMETPDSAKENIGKFNIELGEYFGIETNRPEAKVSNFEDNYGIHSVAVTITGIDLPAHVQKTRDALDEAEQVLKGIAKMYGMTVERLQEKLEKGDITTEQYNDMLDKFAGFSENATLDVKIFKVSQLSEALKIFATVLGETLKKGR